MAAERYLAFDLGAESGRAILGTFKHGKLTLEERHRFPNPTGRINGHLHWNFLQQWEELKTGLKKSRGDGPLAGIGVDTWGVDYVLIDAAGEVVGNPFHYRDTRTAGMLETAFERVPKDRIFDVTGIQFMQLNTLFQLLAQQKQSPDSLKNAVTMLFVPDAFNYLFTGERVSEYSIASTSQMIDARTKTWATGLLGELGLPTHLLPKIVASGTVIGQLKQDVAEECGVEPMRVIAPALHDTASAVAAVPATTKEWCYISSGTWSLMGVELDEPLINEKTLAYNFTNEGGVGGSIRFLQNIMGLWLVQECRREFIKDGYDHSYAELTQMAERVPANRSFIDASDASFVTPGDMPEKIAAFCKKTKQLIPQSRGEFIRCCLDSLAMAYRRTFDRLSELTGKKFEVIHVIGGGSQNKLLNQMTADVCNTPVIAGPVEGTAVGNLIVQAMATGSITSLAEARKVVLNSFEVERVEPANVRDTARAYERYQKLVRV